MRGGGGPNDEKQTIYSHNRPNGWDQVVTYAVIWSVKEGPRLLLCPKYIVIFDVDRLVANFRSDA